MAFTETVTAFEWSTVAFKDILAAGNATSDVIVIPAGAQDISVQIKADNQSTPGSDTDALDVGLLYSSDGTLFDTAGHSDAVPLLNTNIEDPATRSVPLKVKPKQLKIYAENLASADTIRISGNLYYRVWS